MSLESPNTNSTPPLRTRFLLWLTDEESFLGEVKSSEDNNHSRKTTVLAEGIVSLNKAFLTPFHLGLALQLHHEFGSKTLEFLNFN